MISSHVSLVVIVEEKGRRAASRDFVWPAEFETATFSVIWENFRMSRGSKGWTMRLALRRQFSMQRRRLRSRHAWTNTVRELARKISDLGGRSRMTNSLSSSPTTYRTRTSHSSFPSNWRKTSLSTIQPHQLMFTFIVLYLFSV